MWGRAYFTIYGIDINDLTLHEVGNFRKFHEIFQNLQNCKTSKIQKYLKLFWARETLFTHSYHTVFFFLFFLQKDLVNLLSEKEIYDLEMTFRELDKDGDGMITAAEAQLVYTRWLKNLLVVSEGILPRLVL